MIFWPLPRDATPRLTNGDITLRGARAADYPRWRQARLESRAFLKPFEPRWTEADLSRRLFRYRLAHTRHEAAQGREFSFLIFQAGPQGEALVGGITLSNIRRRATQQANLGYWMRADSAGKGIMTRAVALIVPFVFDKLGLHRIEAACLPHNTASRRVLEKNGFREEGYAENYLQIDGAWRDHVLYALTRERYEGTRF